MARVWLIASGKGGVGKSTIASSLGMSLAQRGKRVCLIDADIGLRDQDAMLGLENRIVFDLIHVARKECLLAQALLSPEEAPGLSLLPASALARVKELEASAFRSILVELKAVFDDILIDSPPGIERGLRTLLSTELTHVLLVCTPDDICIRNVKRLIMLLQDKRMPEPQLIVNRLQTKLIAAGEMHSAQAVSDMLALPLIGEIPDDGELYRAALRRSLPMTVHCEAQRALRRIAERMDGLDVPLPGYGAVVSPWYKQLFRTSIKEVKRIDYR